VSAVNLITGGAGFVGSNLAYRLLRDGERVILLDNLSRPNVQRNVAWLRQCFGARSELHVADVLDPNAVRGAVSEADNVFHFAAQVAVTTSLLEPLLDFDVNARGTLNVLEAVRARREPPAVFFTSTNKVYGGLSQLSLSATERGYLPLEAGVQAHGVGEDTPLDFHSPYGCSKGCADQYVRDYARSFGLRCVVFRMSCIYGPRQFGTEDQGWVAHFMLRALAGEPMTLYGDGQQTRDLLFASDLIEAFLAARSALEVCSGEVFNIGGGPDNCVSVLHVLDRIQAITRSQHRLSFESWRTGDQRYYVSDTRKFQRLTGWRPRVGVEEGLLLLAEWLKSAGIAAPVSEATSRDAVARAAGTGVVRAGEGAAE
jgi:CDP-paratose 2-epimerase